MKIFLSYAHEDRKLVEGVKIVLETEDHDVFFDQDDLPAGGKYHTQISEAIKESDLFIAFLSPASLQEGSYTFTEINIASRSWPDPEGHVLAVVIPPNKIDDIFSEIPPYLSQTITIKEVRGNLNAEVRDLVEREGEKHFLENTKKSYKRGYKKGKKFGDRWVKRLFGWAKFS